MLTDWSFIIRLFSVISRTLIGEEKNLTSSAKVPSAYSTAPADCAGRYLLVLLDVNKPYGIEKKLNKELCSYLAISN